jgi:hypothetical protein
MIETPRDMDPTCQFYARTARSQMGGGRQP